MAATVVIGVMGGRALGRRPWLGLDHRVAARHGTPPRSREDELGRQAASRAEPTRTSTRGEQDEDAWRSFSETRVDET
jgi:hypothetical protein